MKPLAYVATLAVLATGVATLAQSPGTTSSSRPRKGSATSIQRPPSNAKAIRQSPELKNQSPGTGPIPPGGNTSPQAKTGSAEISSTESVQPRYRKPPHTPDPGTQPNPLSLDRGNANTAGQQPPKAAR
jgi:hypothetical protein